MSHNALFLTLTALLLIAGSGAAPQAQNAPAAMPPAQPAKDLKDALYKAADALGMLRGPQERDAIVTYEYRATGTLNVGGKPCQLKEYRASVRYPAPDRREPPNMPVPGMRIDYTCEGGPRQVEVVAGEFAWNEKTPGMGATTAPEGALQERLLQLWTLPHGLMKAAYLAGNNAKFAMEAGKPTVTFPLPAPLQAATAKITLDPANFMFHTMPTGVRRYFSHRIERVDVTFNNAKHVITYSDYGDWNASDYKSDVHTPKRIVQERNGVRVADLTVSETQTYNPYVVMPVPENIRKTAAR